MIDIFKYFRKTPVVIDTIKEDEIDSWEYFRTALNGVNTLWNVARFTTQYTNAHVAICVSVLADAIAQLPANIIRVDTIKGARTEIDDNAHPANFMFRGPHPDMTWTDFVQGTIISLLLDGNVYIPIAQVGSQYQLRILDPTTVDIVYNRDKSAILRYDYRNENITQYFQRDQMIHMREFNISEPLKGKSRLEALHKELQMDEYIKEYNSNFFKHGAMINTMFTPDKNLTPDQHKQLQKALRHEIAGVSKAFTLFVNKFPGKLESPDQKHKDIAFLELLKYIRETVNGVFKVPPYKAGILEYANYANSSQQQESFWTDGVKPLIKRVQDIINKDFIWKYFDEQHELKFDLSEIAALQGDPKIQMEIFTGYKREGILTIDEIRADLGRESLNQEQVTNSDTTDQYVRIYDQFFQGQQKRILTALDQKTNQLDSLVTYVTLSDLFDLEKENETLKTTLHPYIEDTITKAGEVAFASIDTAAVFDIGDQEVQTNVRTLDMLHDTINEKTCNMLDQLLTRAKTHKWSLTELKNRIKEALSWAYADQCAKELVPNIIRRATRITQNQKLIEDAVDAVNGSEDKIEEINIGDPGNPYKRKKVGNKYYWSWGSSKWYVGTEEKPPQKLRTIVAAIHAAGFKKK